MEAILFIGIQGSGKTTFYKRRFFETHLRINLDMLKTRHREHLLLETCVKARQRFVVDNTNVRGEDRLRYFNALKGSGFRTVGYFFEPQVERAIAWNAGRSGKAVIPVKGLLGTLKRLERPTIEEGFDELYRVHVNGAGQFVAEPYSC